MGREVIDLCYAENASLASDATSLPPVKPPSIVIRACKTQDLIHVTHQIRIWTITLRCCIPWILYDLFVLWLHILYIRERIPTLPLNMLNHPRKPVFIFHLYFSRNGTKLCELLNLFLSAYVHIWTCRNIPLTRPGKWICFNLFCENATLDFTHTATMYDCF